MCEREIDTASEKRHEVITVKGARDREGRRRGTDISTHRQSVVPYRHQPRPVMIGSTAATEELLLRY